MATMSFLINAINRVLRTEKNIDASESGALFVVHSAAPYEELARDGMSFSGISTTAAAGCIALPTTAANVSLYNAAPSGGKSAIIDAFFAVAIAAHTTLGQSGLIFVLGQTSVASNAGALVIRKLNGLGTPSGSVCLLGDSGTALDAVTGVAIGWTPIGPTANAGVISVPGVVLYAPVDGRIILPPGHLLAVNVMTSNVQNTFNCGILWHERQIKLE
jgi:hypothetical protein